MIMYSKYPKTLRKMLAISIAVIGLTSSSYGLESTTAPLGLPEELTIFEASFLLTPLKSTMLEFAHKFPKTLEPQQLALIQTVESTEQIISEILQTHDPHEINQATLAFFRQNRYGQKIKPIEAMIWANFAGTMPQPLINALTTVNHPKQKEMTQLLALSDVALWQDTQTKAAVDWSHMLAVVDIYTSQIGEIPLNEKSLNEVPLAENPCEPFYDLAFSTGGDLLSFYADVIFSLDGTMDADATGKLLLSESPSHFSRSDYLANIDGTLIARKLTTQRALLSKTIKDYYINADLANRELIYKLHFGGTRSFDHLIKLFCEGQLSHFSSRPEFFKTSFTGFIAFRTQILKEFYDDKRQLTKVERQVVQQLFFNIVNETK